MTRLARGLMASESSATRTGTLNAPYRRRPATAISHCDDHLPGGAHDMTADPPKAMVTCDGQQIGPHSAIPKHSGEIPGPQTRWIDPGDAGGPIPPIHALDRLLRNGQCLF